MAFITSPRGTCPLQGLLSGDTAGRGGEVVVVFQPQGGLSETTGPRSMTFFQLKNPSVKGLTSIYTNTTCLLLLPFLSKKTPPKLKHGDSKEHPLPQGRMKSPITMSQQKPLQLRFGGLVGKNQRRYRPGCLLHPHSGRTFSLRQRAYNRKSGLVGLQKKKGVVKERAFSHQPAGLIFQQGLFRYGIAGGTKAIPLFQQRAMV
ncbi:hypothetical protein BREVNS_2185 [Brevinematales bacterium NS]|nr:hypothetical protein BREVNS_2185 [Brevinematales bacterium NS]